MIMKKVFMAMAIAAAMFAAASCACCNNSENAAEAPAAAEHCSGSCADCAGGCDPNALCASCDSTAVAE